VAIPNYIKKNQCKNTTKAISCEYFMHKDCPETCAYAINIKEPKVKKENKQITYKT